MTPMRPATALAFGLLAWASAATAEQVYWAPPDTLGVGQRGALELVFEDSAPNGPVTVPHVDGLSVLGAPSQATNLAIVNGRRSSSVTLSFPVRAERAGTVQIPAFTVDTDAGAATVAALDVPVGRAAVRDPDGSATALADAVQARLTPANMTPYAGEVFDLELSIALTGNRRGEVVGAPTWNSPGVAVEPWSEGRAVRTASGSAVRFHTRAAAPATAGRIELAPASQDLQIESGRARDAFGAADPFAAMRRFGGANLLGSFLAHPQMTEATVASNAVQLDVQPLPAPAPADFSGAVGQFRLESTLSPEQPKTGEPVTWTLTLTGTGNWPAVALPARAVPTDLRTLQPKAHSQFADGERFHGSMSEDLVLVPNQPGDLALAPVRFVYFNPASGHYETAEAQPPVLHITGAPLAQAPATAPASVAQGASTDAAPTTARTPLGGHAYGCAPLAPRTLALAAGAPFAIVFAAWLGLLAWRAWQADPRRAVRHTRRAVRTAIEATRRAATPDERIAALLAWQRHAARLLGLDLAAPTAAQLRRLDDSRWAALWADSERALYRRDHTLPIGWCDGALLLCAPPPAAVPPPRPQRLRRLVVRTVPAAMLLALALLWLARAAHAEDAPAADAAHVAALQHAAARPVDWTARYDLGVAEAAAQRPGRAFAEFAAAFAQAPRQTAVRAALRDAAGAVPSADAGVVGLAGGSHPAAWLAAWQWQRALLAGAWLMAAALGLAILRRAPRTAWLAAACGVGLIAGAGLALHQYGRFADPRAAFVAQQTVLRAVPTEAQPADGVPPLTAGALVRVERSFLGWTSIRLAGGATGWVRDGELVPVYAAPSA